MSGIAIFSPLCATLPGPWNGAPRLEFAADWARNLGAWVVLISIGIGVASTLLYRRQAFPQGRPIGRWLSVGRGMILALLFLALAAPTVTFTTRRPARLRFWLLCDGTRSMRTQDVWSKAEWRGLRQAAPIASSVATPSRLELARNWLSHGQSGFLQELQTTGRVDAWVFGAPEGPVDLDPVAEQSTWTADGSASAIGDCLEAVQRMPGFKEATALILVSDFAQNSGADARTAAVGLGIPVYTVGVGPRSGADLEVDWDLPAWMTRARPETLEVRIRQTGLDGRSVRVRLVAESTSESAHSGTDRPEPARREQTRTVTLNAASQTCRFEFVPNELGKTRLTVDVDRQPGESLLENNHRAGEVEVRPEYFRVQYVANEPTWEWQWIRRALERDPSVGTHGMRTFLRSADPSVREQSPGLLLTLAPEPAEFFVNDLVILEGMPQAALSTRFCEALHEFVERFGGGLVLLAGPRFGPAEWADSPLADLLPVEVDPSARIRADRDWVPRATDFASRYEFMRPWTEASKIHAVSANPTPASRGEWAWYQPVLGLVPSATALLVHPTDACANGVTPQPLLAIRGIGRGTVVYMACNESWRLRALPGRAHATFWGELVRHLARGRTYANPRRLALSADHTDCAVGDTVRVTVEALDDNFQPRSRHQLASEPHAELRSHPNDKEPVARALLREIAPGVYQAHFVLAEAHEQWVVVGEPFSATPQSIRLSVSNLAMEERYALCDRGLQQELAAVTGGQSYNLTDASRLVTRLKRHAVDETITRTVPLSRAPWIFGLVVGWLSLEWFVRARAHLP